MNDIFDKCFDEEILKFTQQTGIYPYFHALESKQDAVVKMQGHEVIMLGSNNYLNLTTNSSVIEAGINALKNYGTGVSGSRFLNGTTNLHLELENKIKTFLNKESCLIFSSGFNANLGVLSCITNRSETIFCDRENHASIYDGIKLGNAKLERYYHNDMKDLEFRLQNADPNSGKLIVTDGVFSMSGEICNLPEIVKLAKKYNARIMVDDAHGLGVLGKHGRGTAEHFNLENEVDLIMGTFSKSLASLGGYICGKANVISYIKHHSRPFIFAAALPPSNVECARAALETLINKPELSQNLRDLSKYTREKMIAAGLKISVSNDCVPIIPIYTIGKLRTLYACRLLFEKGVYVNPVLPPATPDNDCLIRISLQVNLTKELIDKSVNLIAETLKSLPEDEKEIQKKLINS